MKRMGLLDFPSLPGLNKNSNKEKNNNDRSSNDDIVFDVAVVCESENNMSFGSPSLSKRETNKELVSSPHPTAGDSSNNNCISHGCNTNDSNNDPAGTAGSNNTSRASIGLSRQAGSRMLSIGDGSTERPASFYDIVKNDMQRGQRHRQRMASKRDIMSYKCNIDESNCKNPSNNTNGKMGDNTNYNRTSSRINKVADIQTTTALSLESSSKLKTPTPQPSCHNSNGSLSNNRRTLSMSKRESIAHQQVQKEQNEQEKERKRRSLNNVGTSNGGSHPKLTRSNSEAVIVTNKKRNSERGRIAEPREEQHQQLQQKYRQGTTSNEIRNHSQRTRSNSVSTAAVEYATTPSCSTKSERNLQRQQQRQQQRQRSNGSTNDNNLSSSNHLRLTRSNSVAVMTTSAYSNVQESAATPSMRLQQHRRTSSNNSLSSNSTHHRKLSRSNSISLLPGDATTSGYNGDIQLPTTTTNSMQQVEKTQQQQQGSRQQRRRLSNNSLSSNSNHRLELTRSNSMALMTEDTTAPGYSCETESATATKSILQKEPEQLQKKDLQQQRRRSGNKSLSSNSNHHPKLGETKSAGALVGKATASLNSSSSNRKQTTIQQQEDQQQQCRRQKQRRQSSKNNCDRRCNSNNRKLRRKNSHVQLATEEVTVDTYSKTEPTIIMQPEQEQQQRQRRRESLENGASSGTGDSGALHPMEIATTAASSSKTDPTIQHEKQHRRQRRRDSLENGTSSKVTKRKNSNFITTVSNAENSTLTRSSSDRTTGDSGFIMKKTTGATPSRNNNINLTLINNNRMCMSATVSKSHRSTIASRYSSSSNERKSNRVIENEELDKEFLKKTMGIPLVPLLSPFDDTPKTITSLLRAESLSNHNAKKKEHPPTLQRSLSLSHIQQSFGFSSQATPSTLADPRKTNQKKKRTSKTKPSVKVTDCLNDKDANKESSDEDKLSRCDVSNQNSSSFQEEDAVEVNPYISKNGDCDASDNDTSKTVKQGIIQISNVNHDADMNRQLCAEFGDSEKFKFIHLPDLPTEIAESKGVKRVSSEPILTNIYTSMNTNGGSERNKAQENAKVADTIQSRKISKKRLSDSNHNFNNDNKIETQRKCSTDKKLLSYRSIDSKKNIDSSMSNGDAIHRSSSLQFLDKNKIALKEQQRKKLTRGRSSNNLSSSRCLKQSNNTTIDNSNIIKKKLVDKTMSNQRCNTTQMNQQKWKQSGSAKNFEWSSSRNAVHSNSKNFEWSSSNHATTLTKSENVSSLKAGTYKSSLELLISLSSAQNDLAGGINNLDPTDTVGSTTAKVANDVEETESSSNYTEKQLDDKSSNHKGACNILRLSRGDFPNSNNIDFNGRDWYPSSKSPSNFSLSNARSSSDTSLSLRNIKNLNSSSINANGLTPSTFPLENPNTVKGSIKGDMQTLNSSIVNFCELNCGSLSPSTPSFHSIKNAKTLSTGDLQNLKAIVINPNGLDCPSSSKSSSTLHSNINTQSGVKCLSQGDLQNCSSSISKSGKLNCQPFFASPLRTSSLKTTEMGSLSQCDTQDLNGLSLSSSKSPSTFTLATFKHGIKSLSKGDLQNLNFTSIDSTGFHWPSATPKALKLSSNTLTQGIKTLSKGDKKKSASDVVGLISHSSPSPKLSSDNVKNASNSLPQANLKNRKSSSGCSGGLNSNIFSDSLVASTLTSNASESDNQVSRVSSSPSLNITTTCSSSTPAISSASKSTGSCDINNHIDNSKYDGNNDTNETCYVEAKLSYSRDCKSPLQSSSRHGDDDNTGSNSVTNSVSVRSVLSSGRRSKLVGKSILERQFSFLQTDNFFEMSATELDEKLNDISVSVVDEMSKEVLSPWVKRRAEHDGIDGES